MNLLHALLHTCFAMVAGVVLTVIALPLHAANHTQPLAPLAAGSFPVACSNLAHNVPRMNQLGGLPADFWEGIPDNGTGRYVAQILAEPAAAMQFDLHIPDDRGIYEHFADETLPVVMLVCYPTATTNQRPDYELPDNQWVPKMERTGDLPVFPNAATRYPLLVYGHGLGGSPVSNDYLPTITLLASHGYIVMAPFHGDARITRIRIADLSGVVYFANNFGRYFELQALRPLAMKFGLDYLLTRPGYRDHIDLERIGGFGASLGAQGMLTAMGAHLTQSFSTLSARPMQQDPRIKAAVGYVPFAGMSFLPAFGNDQYGAQYVTRPFLAIAGTADLTSPIKITEQAINRMRGSRYLVALNDVPHDYQPRYSADVFGWTVTFLDAYVKGDPAALHRLVKTGNIAGGLSDEVRIDYTAPTAPGPGEILVTEFHNPRTGHFINALGQTEVQLVSDAAAQGWEATGQAFKAWLPNPAAVTTALPVCRFYRSNGRHLLEGVDTLFLTTDAAVCTLGKSLPAQWVYLGTPIWLRAAQNGNCPDGTIAINRAFNNDPLVVNHRFNTSNAAMQEVARDGWAVEGVEMCAPL